MVRHAPEPAVNLEACLPPRLRGPSTTITRIAAGLSGARVYRVEAGRQTLVLKVAREDEPVDDWRRRLRTLELAAEAGLAPRIVHVDEAERAIVSAFVVDRSFLGFYGDPRTRDAAIASIGRTLRRVHDLPLPPGPDAKEPRELVASIWSGIPATFAVPAFVGGAVRRVLTEDAPARERDVVLSHNDVNPTNVVFDGDNVLLLDWETAGPNDPLYDLAAISMFLRMDDATCVKLIEAHDSAPVANLPARFTYGRRLVAVACGVIFLHLARTSGHAGATGAETLDGTPSLGDVYQRMRAGSLNVGTAEGQWAFGLALAKESVAL